MTVNVAHLTAESSSQESQDGRGYRGCSCNHESHAAAEARLQRKTNMKAPKCQLKTNLLCITKTAADSFNKIILTKRSNVWTCLSSLCLCSSLVYVLFERLLGGT